MGLPKINGCSWHSHDFAPFVDWGKFLPNSPTNVAKNQKLSFLMEPRQTS
jgi:hypothetical protein